MGKIKDNIKILKIGLKEVHKLNKWVISTSIIYAIFSSIAPFVNIYMSARIIDELIITQDLDRIIRFVGITIGLNLIIHLLSTGFHHINTRYIGIVLQNQDMRINEKIINMDYEHIENPEIHALRTKIIESTQITGGGIWGLIKALIQLTQGFTKLIVSIVMGIGLFKGTKIVSGETHIINNPIFSYGFIILLIGMTIINLKLRSAGEKSFSNSILPLWK